MPYLPILKVLIAVTVIVTTSWLSNKRPELAGFIVALPLVSMLALLFSYAEFGNAESTVTFAKSILVGIPVSLLFFLPFLVADRLQLGFWTSYVAGVFLLSVGYFLHQIIIQWIK